MMRSQLKAIEMVQILKEPRIIPTDSNTQLGITIMIEVNC